MRTKEKANEAVSCIKQYIENFHKNKSKCNINILNDNASTICPKKNYNRTFRMDNFRSSEWIKV